MTHLKKTWFFQNFTYIISPYLCICNKIFITIFLNNPSKTPSKKYLAAKMRFFLKIKKLLKLLLISDINIRSKFDNTQK